MKITTRRIYLPLQEKNEWWAYYEGTFTEPNALIGVGDSELEAITDLHRREKGREEEAQ